MKRGRCGDCPKTRTCDHFYLLSNMLKRAHEAYVAAIIKKWKHGITIKLENMARFGANEARVDLPPKVGAQWAQAAVEQAGLGWRLMGDDSMVLSWPGTTLATLDASDEWCDICLRLCEITARHKTPVLRVQAAEHLAIKHVENAVLRAARDGKTIACFTSRNRDVPIGRLKTLIKAEGLNVRSSSSDTRIPYTLIVSGWDSQ